MLLWCGVRNLCIPRALAVARAVAFEPAALGGWRFSLELVYSGVQHCGVSDAIKLSLSAFLVPNKYSLS